MRVEVVLFGMLRERFARESKGRLLVRMQPGSTLSDLLAQLGLGEPIPALRCSLNGEFVQGWSIPLKEGDTVHLFQAVGGG